MTEPLSTTARGDATAVLLQPEGHPAPPWAERAAVRVLPPDALADGAARTALRDVGCVLLDASVAGFIDLARRANAADPSVQVVAVTPPERLQATRRALLYAPGLGEVWIASPVDVTGAFTERAAGVTRQRRRFERTRARMERERLSASPQRTERALISDAYLAGLLRVLPDPVFSVNAGGRVLSANAAAETMFGGRGVDLLDAHLGVALGLDGAGGEEIALLERAAGDGHVSLSFRRSDGRAGIGELRATPMSVGGAGWAVVLRDVTEERQTYERLQETARKLELSYAELRSTTGVLRQRTAEAERAAAALRQSESVYRALADALPTLAWTAQADGYIDWYNHRWYEYTGTAPEQMAGWGWQSVHDPDVLPTVLTRWKSSIVTGEPFEMVFPLRGADGQFRAFLTRVVPLRDEAGRVVRWFGTNTDVEAEHASRKRIERLQQLTEALAATRTLDDVAHVLVEQVRSATGAVTGTLFLRDVEYPSRLVMLGQAGLTDDIASSYRFHSVDHQGPAAECVRLGAPIFLETRAALLAKYPRLEAVWNELGSQAVAAVPLAAAGETVGVMSFTFTTPREFTPDDRAFFLALGRQCAQAVERARLFAAEQFARARADEANRAKGQFLANMSHELRTPLNAITGHVQLIELELHGPVTAEQRAALARVQKAQRHLLGLINDILNYAKLEAGQVEFRAAAVRIADVVRDVLPMIEPQVADKGLAFSVDVPDPTLAVWADHEKLTQILLNLLSNAVKFTPALQPDGSRGCISLDALVPAESSDVVDLRVRDTGIGIAPEKQDSIFDPFVQVISIPMRPHEGTGLGLAISRDLARGMEGELWVRSTPGAGSTFTVTLRRAMVRDDSGGAPA